MIRADCFAVASALLLCHCGFDHDGTFNTLAEQFAACLVDAADGTRGVEGVGRAAAGAVESRPAVIALRPGVGVAGAELLPQGGVGHAVPNVAQLVGLLAHKLVEGVTAIYSVPEPQPEIRL